MKSQTFTLIAVLILVTGNFAKASSQNQADGQQVELSEEAYVDDVPFDTKEIVAGLEKNQKQKENDGFIQLSEEEYVNDVNINTHQVVAEHCKQLLLKSRQFARALGQNYRAMERENFLNQNEINLSKIITILFNPEEDVQLSPEPYVNDVPFETSKVATNK